MKIGTKVTYTQKGYARDFIYTMTSLTAISNLKKEEYTQRKGIVTNIEKAKCGLVTYTVKWEDVGGYFQDDTSYVQDEDIQEIEEEAPTNKGKDNMTRSEKRRQRREAERQAKILEINSQYELIESGELTVEQKKILESEGYNKWVVQQTRCFDRNGDELSVYLTQKYKDLTNNIIFTSMDIDWAIFLFESQVVRSWELLREIKSKSLNIQ